MEIGRPSTKSQSSRKSKKAWRKNINLDDISKGIDNAREYERNFGMKESKLSEADDNLLFEVDSTGDEMLKTRRERAVKPMKMDEILDRSKKSSANSSSFSKHPGLSNSNQQKPQKSLDKKLNKNNYIPKSELDRLRRLAGQNNHDKSSSSISQIVESSGFQSASLYDAWGEDAVPDSTPDSITKETKHTHKLHKSTNTKQTNNNSNGSSKKKTKQTNGTTVPTTGSFIDGLTPTISFIKPQAPPTTLKEAPVPVINPDEKNDTNKIKTVPSSSSSTSKSKKSSLIIAAVPIPDAGKSYNPTLEDWAALVRREHELEEKREIKRIELEKERERIQYLIETYDDHNELSESESEEEESEEEESEEEEEEKDNDDDKTKDKSNNDRLSVNPAVKAKKKTRTQRNKQRRHIEKMKLEQELKHIRQQLKQIENIPILLSELEQQITKATTKDTSDDDNNDITSKTYDGDSKRRRVTLKRHERIVQMPLEIKLSDELSDSLRLLKPEGNMALERFKSLQERGLIDIPGDSHSNKRKATYKEVEKMTYKYLFEDS